MTLTIPKHTARTMLFIVFCLAYIAAPYWRIPAAATVSALLCCVSIGLGAMWAVGAGGMVQLAVDRRAIGALALLFAIAFLINYPSLSADIPVGGDENYHILVVKIVSAKKYLLSMTTAVLLLALLIVARFPAVIYSAWAALAVSAVLFAMVFDLPSVFLLRYPFLSRYVQVIPLVVTKFIGLTAAEPVYRLVPCGAAAMLAWLIWRAAPSPLRLTNWLAALAVLTLPVVRYYASILYIEMPMVVLMTLTGLSIDQLRKADFKSVRASAAWLSLVVLAFLKETALPFLAAVTLFRLISRLGPFRPYREPDDSPATRRNSRDEAVFIFGVFLPLSMFLGYRSFYGHFRVHALNFSNLADTRLYMTTITAYLEQFGLFVVLFIAGCLVMGWKKKYGQLGFVLSLFLLCFLFFATDELKYAGYSRFNLYVLPAILLASVELFNAARDNRRLTLIVLSAVLIVNLMLSPVHWDGSKKPLWGNDLTDTSEHYYPYRKTMNWLKANAAASRIYFANVEYTFLNFYFDSLNWRPPQFTRSAPLAGDTGTLLERHLDAARIKGFDTVVFPLPLGESDSPARYAEFKRVEVLRNEAHRIAVYSASENESLP